MNVADVAFAVELFIVIFVSYCWLFSSSRPRNQQIYSTRSIRYFDPLDEQNTPTPELPVSKSQLMPLLPDPWDSEECMSERTNLVSSTSNVAPMRFQLCLPPAKKDVGLDIVLTLVQTRLTLEKAKKVLTVFADKHHLSKPKSRIKKAELISQIETYLLDFNYKNVMQELVCNAIGGRL